MQEYLLDFNSFVSELVSYHIRMDKNINISSLSEKIGLSSSFVHKALSSSTGKHFNLRHIFLISQAMNLSMEDLVPSKENYKLITNKELSEEEWSNFINNMKKEREE